MSMVQIQCAALLELYDNRQKDGGFATAISALAGEELGLALLQHNLNSLGTSVQSVGNVPTTGKQKGFRLDGWLLTPEILYQVEVKNWGANAIGGKPYDGDLKAGWEQFIAWFRDPGLQKVLYPMVPPSSYASMPVEAIACMWPTMNPDGLSAPWFSVPSDQLPPVPFDYPFTKLNVFSMSGYLRQTSSETLDLEMPKTYRRLKALESLFVTSNLVDHATANSPISRTAGG
ncbi:MAG: hypothetical protein V4671_28650 [Armatimonadota bacterium]